MGRATWLLIGCKRSWPWCAHVFFSSAVRLHSSAFGGLLRDPIGSTKYWEIDRAVMRFLHCSFFVLQFFLHCKFFCVAVGPGHAHMTPWLITHNLIYVAAADDDVDVVLSSNIFRQIFTRGEKVSITT